MFQLDKYRLYDYITIQGIDADIYKENEHGELITPEFSKDFSFFKAVSTIAEDLTVPNTKTGDEWQSAQNWFMSVMSDKFYFDKIPMINDFCICGDTIQFWNKENADGLSDETNGKFYVLYTLIIKINGVQVEENDLHYLFVGMGE